MGHIKAKERNVRRKLPPDPPLTESSAIPLVKHSRFFPEGSPSAFEVLPMLRKRHTDGSMPLAKVAGEGGYY